MHRMYPIFRRRFLGISEIELAGANAPSTARTLCPWNGLYFGVAFAAAFTRRTSLIAAPATATTIIKSTKPYEYHTLA